MENSDLHQRRSIASGQKRLQANDTSSSIPQSIGLLSNDAKDAVNEARRPHSLLKFDELPDWRRDNQYITGKYRQTSNSYVGSFVSLGYLHNEFVNIYTHAIGAIFYPMVGVILYVKLKDRYASASIGDVLACSCFFLGALLCLGMSATYHTITNHSPSVARFGNSLDYLGIVCLISGSYVPAIYYGFYCDGKLQVIYWTMMGIIGLACAIMSIRPEFGTPHWRTFRAFMFVGMGLSSIVSVGHGCMKYGAGQFNRQMRFEWMIYEGIQYILGAAIYAARLPERFSPGTFNIWGSSHQIFHCLVLSAAGTHLFGIMEALDYVHQHPDCIGGA